MVTRLERDDELLGVLVHDPAIEVEDPGLVEAVGNAARLALENERLAAEVRAQLEEVRASRLRIVEAADAERRRSSATSTTAPSSGSWRSPCGSRSPRAPPGDGTARRGDGRARDRHRRGPGPAGGSTRPSSRDRPPAPRLEALAERTPFPVAVDVTIAIRRAGRGDGLLRHRRGADEWPDASATEARVVAEEDGRLVVTVADDGRGGADPPPARVCVGWLTAWPPRRQPDADQPDGRRHGRVCRSSPPTARRRVCGAGRARRRDGLTRIGRHVRAIADAPPRIEAPRDDRRERAASSRPDARRRPWISPPTGPGRAGGLEPSPLLAHRAPARASPLGRRPRRRSTRAARKARRAIEPGAAALLPSLRCVRQLVVSATLDTSACSPRHPSILADGYVRRRPAADTGWRGGQARRDRRRSWARTRPERRSQASRSTTWPRSRASCRAEDAEAPPAGPRRPAPRARAPSWPPGRRPGQRCP